MKSESNYSQFKNLGSGNGFNSLPIQAIPLSKKTKKWKKACVDALERQGITQVEKNIRFRDYRAMTEGRFTYAGTGFGEFQEMPWFDKEIRKLRSDNGIPTYIKHFDFIGIIVKALAGIYTNLDDKYRVESTDEYFTNEYIRTKTEMLHKYAARIFKEETDKLLLIRGIDPNKADFESEEEQQQYQETVQKEAQALTPPEIEQFMAKNFKILAIEWAQNTLTSDKEEFYLEEEDRELFIDYLLTGRWFRHYRVGYDNYSIETWKPEETFFSEDVDAKFPQDGEFVGRITTMGTSNILNKFGHLMSAKQIEDISNYWNQSSADWENGANYTRDSKGVSPIDAVFPQHEIVPFHNYKDHLINTQLEDTLGVPLGQTIDQNGNPQTRWLPRQGNDFQHSDTEHSSYLRDDINVRKDAVRVTEGYWRSWKRIGILIYENQFGSVSLEIVTDELIDDFIEDNEIKKLKNLSLNDLKLALKEERLDEYVNTITYTYVPEVWKFVKIKGNGSTIKDDLYLDVRPLDYQIRGSRSQYYDVLLPVGGMIDTGIAVVLEPYQQLHNITMNQNTELLEKELGVFFMFDITGLPAEYQDQTTQDALYQIRENIKDTGLAPFDLSRQNTQGNQPNLFARQEITFGNQMQQRMSMAEYYKQQGFNQIGLTPQLLGQMGTYETAEGVKQGVQASHTLINQYFDKMNRAKAKSNELHLAIAQYCVVEGKDKTLITRKGDGELRFIDIMKEDGELFPLRYLGVKPVASSKDRKIVEQIKQYIFSDNTIQKTYSDVISLLSNPVLSEINQVAKEIEATGQRRIQEDRAFQQQQLQEQIKAQASEKQADREQEIKLKNLDIEGDLKVKYIDGMSRVSDKNLHTEAYGQIEDAYQQTVSNNFQQQNLNIKTEENQRKKDSDLTTRQIELQKLALKSKELSIKEKAIMVQQEGNIINKN